jgi:hypothetical protein
VRYSKEKAEIKQRAMADYTKTRQELAREGKKEE